MHVYAIEHVRVEELRWLSYTIIKSLNCAILCW